MFFNKIKDTLVFMTLGERERERVSKKGMADQKNTHTHLSNHWFEHTLLWVSVLRAGWQHIKLLTSNDVQGSVNFSFCKALDV